MTLVVTATGTPNTATARRKAVTNCAMTGTCACRHDEESSDTEKAGTELLQQLTSTDPQLIQPFSIEETLL